MKTELTWMHHGTNRGKGALVVSDKENPRAVALALRDLKRKRLKFPTGATIDLWCGGEYFRLKSFNSEFRVYRSSRGIKSIFFSANCETDGLVQFVWQRNSESRKCSKRKIVDSIAFWRP